MSNLYLLILWLLHFFCYCTEKSHYPDRSKIVLNIRPASYSQYLKDKK